MERRFYILITKFLNGKHLGLIAKDKHGQQVIAQTKTHHSLDAVKKQFTGLDGLFGLDGLDWQQRTPQHPKFVALWAEFEWEDE